MIEYARNSFIKRFTSLNSWKRRGERAPHKPLLILYALGRLSRGESRLCEYSVLENPLCELLQSFGPYRASYHPSYPFCRLANEEGNIWELQGVEHLPSRKCRGSKSRQTDDYQVSDLRRLGVKAGFPEPDFEYLKTNPMIVAEIAGTILEQNFPATVHADILQRVGLNLLLSFSFKKKRDPNFRNRIMLAYGHQCAVCGFDVRISNITVGLEAAHVRWHQANGPDVEENGLALCSLHHKLFDNGAFTLDRNHVLLVSEMAIGSTGFDEWLMRFHGKPIREPVRQSFVLKNEFVHWHAKEVFKGSTREIF